MPKVNWGEVARVIGEEGGPFIDIRKDPKAPSELLIYGGTTSWSAEKTHFNPPISISQLDENSSGPVVEILRQSYKWISPSHSSPEQIPRFWVN
jgi:hypothetical protein